MRCLYCGKPLPLLKKLTGGGEFCSDAHRHKYQEEYNKLALSRLLQAQSAPGETGVFPTPGGNGLRQLAAPSQGGQRALPPPSAPAPPPVAPPLPPTAHHQQAAHHQLEAPPVAPPPLAPPPQAKLDTKPKPKPLPDPPEAPFLVEQHGPIAPEHPAAVLKNLEGLFGESKPQHGIYDLAVVPFDWESTASALAASQEPDPPEAPAWRHPIEIQAPGEPMPAGFATFPPELFPAKPMPPVQPEVSFGFRFPHEIQPKVNLGSGQIGSGKAKLQLVPGQMRLSGVRDWELNLRTPDWRPGFATIGAPPPPVAPTPQSTPAPVVETEPARPLAAPAVELQPQTGETKSSVEVFVDLSALGIFE